MWCRPSGLPDAAGVKTGTTTVSPADAPLPTIPFLSQGQTPGGTYNLRDPTVSQIVSCQRRHMTMGDWRLGAGGWRRKAGGADRSSAARRPIVGGCAVAIAGLVIAAGTAGQAQAPRPMTLVDLREVPSVLDPQLAPDGRAVVYQLNQVDWAANRRPGHIWRQDVAGGAPVQLTSAASGEAAPRWSPDSTQILFVRDGQIVVMPAGGGEARVVTRHASGVSSPTWSPDGAFIYFLAVDPRTADERARIEAKDDVYAFNEDYRQRHLWRVAAASGTEQAVTRGDFSVTSYRLSRDGARLAVHRMPSPLALDNARNEVWLMDASGERPVRLTDNVVEEGEAEISPDGSQVLFVAEANQRFEPYHNATLFLVPAAGGTAAGAGAGLPLLRRSRHLGARRPLDSRSSRTWACTARSSRSISRPGRPDS